MGRQALCIQYEMTLHQNANKRVGRDFRTTTGPGGTVKVVVITKRQTLDDDDVSPGKFPG